ncbi:MAG: hypothetical protein QT07_C0009G0015 [archaeon GW2011_AR16]|nr:MAG: hypothetical protein QT07_C0009G0015 [archaeon GW2011_AR16]
MHTPILSEYLKNESTINVSKTMKMKKRGVIFVVLLVLVLLLVASCAGGGRLRRSRSQAQPYNFHVGSQGVQMHFLQGNPPQRLYEGDPLTMILEYANKGAYDITDGRLYISGYDREYVRLEAAENPLSTTFTAEGKDEFNPMGEITDVKEYKDPAVSMPPNVDIFRQVFKATACYKYRTEASPTVCIDPDPLSVDPEDKVCIVTPMSLGSQGAPVAVSSIEPEVARDRAQFKINIANVGTGTVIESAQGRSPIERCHADLKRDEIDKVEIHAFISDTPLECKPDIVRLTNGNGFSFCTLDLRTIQQREAYQTILNVYLDYGYRDSIATAVDILRLPGAGDDRLSPYYRPYRRD